MDSPDILKQEREPSQRPGKRSVIASGYVERSDTQVEVEMVGQKSLTERTKLNRNIGSVTMVVNAPNLVRWNEQHEYYGGPDSADIKTEMSGDFSAMVTYSHHEAFPFSKTETKFKLILSFRDRFLGTEGITISAGINIAETFETLEIAEEKRRNGIEVPDFDKILEEADAAATLVDIIAESELAQIQLKDDPSVPRKGQGYVFGYLSLPHDAEFPHPKNVIKEAMHSEKREAMYNILMCGVDDLTDEYLETMLKMDENHPLQYVPRILIRNMFAEKMFGAMEQQFVPDYDMERMKDLIRNLSDLDENAIEQDMITKLATMDAQTPESNVMMAGGAAGLMDLGDDDLQPVIEVSEIEEEVIVIDETPKTKPYQNFFDWARARVQKETDEHLNDYFEMSAFTKKVAALENHENPKFKTLYKWIDEVYKYQYGKGFKEMEYTPFDVTNPIVRMAIYGLLQNASQDRSERMYLFSNIINSLANVNNSYFAIDRSPYPDSVHASLPASKLAEDNDFLTNLDHWIIDNDESGEMDRVLRYPNARVILTAAFHDETERLIFRR